MESGKLSVLSGIRLLNLADISLIVVIIAISIIAYGRGFYSDRNEIKHIQVIIEGTITGAYELSKDQIVEINSGTILEIKDGRFRLRESSCPRQICVKQGWSISQPVICVPQKLVISPMSQQSETFRQILTY
jgi:hypothetical protein